MADKNTVDDYYSQINASSDDSTKNPLTIKPKIIAKKKIIVKKPQATSGNEVVSSGNIKTDETKNFKKTSSNTKGFVQKMEVVKKVTTNDNNNSNNTGANNNNRPSNNASNYKNNTNNNNTANNNNSGPKKEGARENNKPRKFTIIKRGDPDFVDRSKKREPNNNGTDVKFKLRSSTDNQTKVFSNNKKSTKSSDFVDSKDHKKSKLAGGDRRTRGRFDFVNDKDLTFTRSNKVNKKEEKNIEDIKQNLIERKGGVVTVSEFLTLKELSEKLGVVLPMLMAEFMKNGMMVNINSKIDYDSASIIAEAFEIKLEKDTSSGASVEDIITGDLSELLKEDDQTKLKPRGPVVSIMGHVDHGKTSLLDHIRKSKVASGEAGGITQSIGAYQVELENGKITFLDTPGHEAFTIMRARGAKLTDIAVLVVAADEGVKPQTIESINHAKEAGIPVVVAINKMDKEGANPDFVKGQLAENGLSPEDWGGDTPMVPISAQTGFGIEDLLEIILLVAEMKELKANPDRAGIATIIESHLDSRLGPVATILINAGTIKMGDNVVCQNSYGKIKVLKNHNNVGVKFAFPGEPALVVGLDRVVDGGDILQVVNSVELAKQKAEEYSTILAKQKLVGSSGLALLMSKIQAGNLKQLKIILKAETNGSLEAIRGSLLKLSTPETTVEIIHAGVGSISEGDIVMGQGSEAILIGFNVGVLPTAKGVLDSSKVEFISSEIIYHITERIEKIISGMLDPKEVEIELGKAKVGGIFFTDKGFMILGLKVGPDSIIEKDALVRVIRNKKMIGVGKIESLKSGTIEVKDLEGPIECGIKFVGSVAVENGDDLEIHKIIIEK